MEYFFTTKVHHQQPILHKAAAISTGRQLLTCNLKGRVAQEIELVLATNCRRISPRIHQAREHEAAIGEAHAKAVPNLNGRRWALEEDCRRHQPLRLRGRKNTGSGGRGLCYLGDTGHSKKKKRECNA